MIECEHKSVLLFKQFADRHSFQRSAPSDDTLVRVGPRIFLELFARDPADWNIAPLGEFDVGFFADGKTAKPASFRTL